MNGELVRCLRHCVDAPAHRGCAANCKYGKEHPLNYLCISVMMQEAADAIEGLSAYVRQIEQLRKDGYYLQKTKMMTYGQATMTQPLPEPPKEEGWQTLRNAAVPVPPHGRLIDADALDADLEWQDMHTGEWDAVGFSIEEIENAPTIIPAEEGET